MAQSLDAQINDIVTTEAGLIEKFKATSIAFHTAADFKPDGLIADFDKLWLPKAPQIADLRKAVRRFDPRTEQAHKIYPLCVLPVDSVHDLLHCTTPPRHAAQAARR